MMSHAFRSDWPSLCLSRHMWHCQFSPTYLLAITWATCKMRHVKNIQWRDTPCNGTNETGQLDWWDTLRSQLGSQSADSQLDGFQPPPLSTDLIDGGRWLRHAILLASRSPDIVIIASKKEKKTLMYKWHVEINGHSGITCTHSEEYLLKDSLFLGSQSNPLARTMWAPWPVPSLLSRSRDLKATHFLKFQHRTLWDFWCVIFQSLLILSLVENWIFPMEIPCQSHQKLLESQLIKLLYETTSGESTEWRVQNPHHNLMKHCPSKAAFRAKLPGLLVEAPPKLLGV